MKVFRKGCTPMCRPEIEVGRDSTLKRKTISEQVEKTV